MVLVSDVGGFFWGENRELQPYPGRPAVPLELVIQQEPGGRLAESPAEPFVNPSRTVAKTPVIAGKTCRKA